FASVAPGSASYHREWGALLPHAHLPVRSLPRLHLHERPADLPRFRLAEEVAFLLRAVVVAAAEGAAAVGGEGGGADLALGEAVEVAVEDGLEVVLLEARQQVVGVQRAGGGVGTEGEVGEEDRRALPVQLRQVVVEP